jgi:hypothetical protein
LKEIYAADIKLHEEIMNKWYYQPPVSIAS